MFVCAFLDIKAVAVFVLCVKGCRDAASRQQVSPLHERRPVFGEIFSSLLCPWRCSSAPGLWWELSLQLWDVQLYILVWICTDLAECFVLLQLEGFTASLLKGSRTWRPLSMENKSSLRKVCTLEWLPPSWGLAITWQQLMWEQLRTTARLWLRCVHHWIRS